ncbi:MAG: pentapeptide repeat-containing protein [Pseudomonadota bacterium]
MSISQDWWDAWWEEDYSWEGLAEKPWLGWYVDAAWIEGQPFEPVPEDERVESVEYRRATLQDYWRRAQIETRLSDKDFFAEWIPDDEDGNPEDEALSFTIMHLPPEMKTGLKTAKSNPRSISGRLNRVLRAELKRTIKTVKSEEPYYTERPDHRMQWQGAIILDLDLISHVKRDEVDEFVPVSIRAENAAFLGKANFELAEFFGHLSFERAAFFGHSSFARAIFNGQADFEDVVFGAPANFKGAKLRQYTSFRGTKFLEDVDFRSVEFYSHVNFSNVVFKGYAAFRSVIFAGDAGFEHASFSSITDFDYATFSEAAYFNDAAFDGNTFFNRGSFCKSANFEGGAFSGPARFDEAVFLSDTIFSGNSALVLSEERAGSKQAAQCYFRMASFDNAIFMGAARFDNRDFHSAASFDGAKFYREAEFHGSSLHRGILFTQTTFDLALTPEKRTPDAIPKDALERLYKAAMLGTSEDEKQDLETWAKQRFAEIAKRDDAIKPETDPARSRYFERVEEGFRTLKHAMEDRRNRGQEARFFQLELRARRERRDEKFVPKWERIFSDVYKWTSNFGTSVGRPLLCLLLLTVIGFPFLYLLMGAGFTHWPTAAEFGDAMGYSFARIMPFGPWEDPKPCSMTGRMLAEIVQPDCPPVQGLADLHYRGGTPFWLRFWGSVQSFSALVLVFLSGLAIRRRFQIN